MLDRPVRWLFGCILLAPLLFATTSSFAEETPARYLESMRLRRLDSLLEYYCKSRMQAADLSEQEAALLASEYSALLAMQAAETIDPAQRQEKWRQARQLLADSQTRTTDVYIEFSTRLQQALLEQTEGMWLRQWAELQGKSPEEATDARERLRQAVAMLTQLDRQIEAKVNDSGRRLASERAALQALQSLRDVVGIRLAAAELELAKTYADDDPKRRTTLQSAVARLEPLTLSTGDALAFQATLDHVAAHRMLGNAAKARTLLDSLDKATTDPARRESILAERVEGLLAEGKQVEALGLLQPVMADQSPSSGGIDYLYLRVLLEQADKMADDPKKAGVLQASAFSQLRRLETEHPGHWARRAELLVGKFASRLSNQESANLRRAAESMMRSENFAGAASVLRQAAAEAEKNNKPQEAFTLWFQAGEALERAGKQLEAAATFEELADHWKDHSQAPQALLQAALALRQAYRADPKKEIYERLDELLRRSLARYPKAPSAGDVRFLLASLRVAERDYGQAVSQFLATPVDHRLRNRALIEASRVYESWLQPLTPSAPAVGDAIEAAIGFHRDVLSGVLPTEQELSPADRAELTLRLGRILLDSRVARPGQAETWLSSLLTSPSLPDKSRGECRRYLILALVQQDKFQEAQRIALQVAEGPLEDILVVLDDLNQVAFHVAELRRRFIGQVQKRITETVERRKAEISGDKKYAFELAQAYADLNNGSDPSLAAAAERFAMLQKQNPRDARLVEGLGLAEMRSRRYEQAIAHWRALIAGVKEGTPTWYRAKLSLVTCLRRIDQKNQAIKVIQLLETLHPEMGGEELKQRFLEEKSRLTESS